MSKIANEKAFEDKVAGIFESMGYAVIDGQKDEAWQLNKMKHAVKEDELKKRMMELNESDKLPEGTVDLAFEKVLNFNDCQLPQGASYVYKNKLFTQWIRYGVPVMCVDGKERKVRLVDYGCPAKNNVFHCVRQFTYKEDSERRPDLVIFLNGLPIAVIELKSPVRKSVDTKSAYNQINIYMKEISTLFAYNCICVISDGHESLLGTITSDYEHFTRWNESGDAANSETFFRGIFTKRYLLYLIKDLIFYREAGSNPQKIVAPDRQYVCAKKAFEATEDAFKSKRDGVIGTVCVDAALGESYIDSMLSYVRSVKMSEKLKDATIVVVTDDDCRESRYRQFKHCPDLSEYVYRVKGLEAFNKFFDGSYQGTNQEKPIIVTPLNVLEKIKELNLLKKRDDIIVIADNLSPKNKPCGGRTLEQYLLEYLPEATYIGFRDTPGEEHSDAFGLLIRADDVKHALEETEKVFKSERDGVIGSICVVHGGGYIGSVLSYAHQVSQSGKLKIKAIVMVSGEDERRGYFYEQFKSCSDLACDACQAENRIELKDLLGNINEETEAKMMIFTTLDVLAESDKSCLTARDDILVIVDDVYRKHEIAGGRTLEQVLKSNLPQALYIGFTGLPADGGALVFGPLIYEYGMEQAIEDGVTYIEATEDVFGIGGVIGSVYVPHDMYYIDSLLHYACQVKQSINKKLKDATIVVVTDEVKRRRELHKTFKSMPEFSDFVYQVGARDMLRKFFDEKHIDEKPIIVTTLDVLVNFNEPGPLTKRNDILVIVDNVYRKHEISGGRTLEQVLHENLPKASYIGFTGTPVDENPHGFGPLIYEWGMKQALEDSVTCVEATEKAFKKGCGVVGVVYGVHGRGNMGSIPFYVRQLKRSWKFKEAVIVVVTGEYGRCLELWKLLSCPGPQKKYVYQVGNRDKLKNFFDGKPVDEKPVIVTTLDVLGKFKWSGLLTESDDVIVIVDDVYRKRMTRGGLSLEQVLHESLPNASRVGFTRSPINENYGEFGPLICEYGMKQAIEDALTCETYYESRAGKLSPDDNKLARVDRELKSKINADPEIIKEIKETFSQIEYVLGSSAAVNYAASDLINHYEKHSEYTPSGKAVILAQSPSIAGKLYKEITRQRPAWEKEGKIKILMLSESAEDGYFYEHACKKTELEVYLEEFKDDKSNLKIAITDDVLLCGVDIPSLSMLYIYKQLSARDLIEAVGRVNLACPGKTEGLIVDYIGLLPEIDKVCLHHEGNGLSAFLDHLSECYKDFPKLESSYKQYTVTNSDPMKVIRETTEEILKLENGSICSRFWKTAKGLIDEYTALGVRLSGPKLRKYMFLQNVHNYILKEKLTGKEKEDIGALVEDCIKAGISVNETLADLPPVKCSHFDQPYYREFVKRRYERQEAVSLGGSVSPSPSMENGANAYTAEEFSDVFNSCLDKFNENVDETARAVKAIAELEKKQSDA